MSAFPSATHHPSLPLSRRGLLAGTAALAVTLAGCSTAPSDTGTGGPRNQPSSSGAPSGGTTGGAGPLTWWDQFAPLKALQEKTFASYKATSGTEVKYTVYNPADQGKALQLAFSSKQLPDVFTLAGLQTAPAALRATGWFSPLTNAQEIRSALPEGALIEGVHSFDGQLYSFPIFSPRFYDCLVWHSKAAASKAGLDPEVAPKSWDDLRAAVKAVKDSGTAGIVLPLQLADRMAALVMNLAQAAGFPGVDGIELATGEYLFHHQSVLDAIELLTSFKTDGTMLAASTSLDARNARARWAAGAAGFFLDGPYCVGVVVKDLKDFTDQLAVSGIPTPDGSEPKLSRPPTGGTYWVSSQSDKVDKASAAMALAAAPEYQAGLAVAMDAPPLAIESVASSQAHPTYKTAIDLFSKQVTVAPTALARPGVAAVVAATTKVEPGLGPIIQGIFSGQVSDAKKALTDLSSQLAKARDEAIAKVGGPATKASWAFPTWKRETDFDPAGY